MKNPRQNHFLFALLAHCGAALATTHAADLFWDGGTIGGTGNGAATYAGGTWSTANANWDQGVGLSRLVWNNAALDTAVFGGTYSAGTKTVTIGSDITVNQIQVLTGSTGGNRYDIGNSNTQSNFAITFGGTYTSEFPAITGNANFLNNNFNAKVTGTVAGGLVIRHGSNITTPGSSGRFAFTNANSDFIGDVVMAAGNLSVGTQMGAAGNKLVLKGGSLFVSGGAAVTTVFSRAIDVASASGISTNAATSGLQVLELTGPITGSGDLIRYSATAGSAISEVRLRGDLSGYTGLFENRGSAATHLTIQSTATSGGSWKLTGGITKLDTVSNDAIAHGTGKSDLLMNGGILDLNGKIETINGLSGTTGSVRNNLAATTSTITLGDGDSTAEFGGGIVDGNGVVALTKIGLGIQTLSGSSTYTGDTQVSSGTLLVTGALGGTTVTVEDGATFGGGGVLAGSLHFDIGAKLIFNPADILTVNGLEVTFDGFGIANLMGLTSATPNGEYILIDGSANVSTVNLANLGIGQAASLGPDKFAYLESGSLKLIVIPEPSTALLGGIGLVALLRRRRA